MDPTLTKPETSNKTAIVTTRLSKEVFVHNTDTFYSKLTPRGPHPCQATKLKQNNSFCKKNEHRRICVSFLFDFYPKSSLVDPTLTKRQKSNKTATFIRRSSNKTSLCELEAHRSMRSSSSGEGPAVV